MKRIITLSYVLLITCIVAGENTRLIELKPVKKVIHVEQLGLSLNTTVKEVLDLMPELLDRATDDYLYSRYSIQFDERDVGAARDVVLSQTILAEVEAIEISTSPVASDQKNGMSGVINIKPKVIAEDGLSGYAMLDAYTTWDVQPTVLLNYKKKDLVIRTGLMLEYYRPTTMESGWLEGQAVSMKQYDTMRVSYKQEAVKFNLEYKPTKQDFVKLNVWESFSHTRYNVVTAMDSMLRVDNPNQGVPCPIYELHKSRATKDGLGLGLNLEVQASYTHNYTRGGFFEVGAAYSYAPIWHDQTEVNHSIVPAVAFGGDRRTGLNDVSHKHNLNATIKSLHPLFQKKPNHLLNLEYGLNVSLGFGEERITETLFGSVDSTETKIGLSTPLTYLSPYMEWNYDYAGWHFQLGASYQYYKSGYDLLDGEHAWSYDNHTWMGNVNVKWQVKDHHVLRLSGARNVIHTVSPEGIDASPCYNAEAVYVYDYDNDGHYVASNVGLHYIYTKLAQGKDRTGSVNLQLLYRHGRLSMAFAGNWYIKGQYGIANNPWNWYYNVSMTPVLKFRKQWTLSFKVVYNSSIQAWNATYGDCFYTQVRVSKDIKNWSINMQLSDMFGYTSFDRVETADGIAQTMYNMYGREFSLGFVCKIGK